MHCFVGEYCARGVCRTRDFPHRRWLAQRHKSGRSGTSGQVPEKGGKGRNVFTSGYANVQRECRFSINNYSIIITCTYPVLYRR